MQKSPWNIFKSSLKQRLPRYVIDTLGKYRYKFRKSQFEGKEMKEIFHEIYRSNLWKNSETVSGPGSTIKYTESLIPELTNLFSVYNIHSLVDIPCGDFNWMKNMDLQSIQYMGLDIVADLIDNNTEKFKSENIQFRRADITKDDIPPGDLIFCRDCLVHFSYSDINNALANIKKSGCTYLMTTSFQFPMVNYDIQTGDWRPLNLERPPFNFPPPIYILEDRPANLSPGYDLKKILGLWKIADLGLKGRQ